MRGDSDSYSAPDLALWERLWVGGGVLLLAAISWVYTVRMVREMAGAGHAHHAAAAGVAHQMAGHAAHHGMAGHEALHAVLMPGLALPGGHEVWMTLVMWCVMMAAMMLPTAVPMTLAFAAMNRRGAGPVLVPVGAFTAGYLAAWVAYSAGATALQLGLQGAALLAPATLSAGPALGGGLLVAAGLFQFSPWKDACLEKCRNPFGFLLTHWRPGRLGALRLGSRYGLYCVGCCWLLMLLSFSLGVMNLTWMAALTAFMLLEKIVPAGRLFSRAAGVALVLWGGWLLV